MDHMVDPTEFRQKDWIKSEKISANPQPGGLLSMGSHRVEHDWSDLAAAAAAALEKNRTPFFL